MSEQTTGTQTCGLISSEAFGDAASANDWGGFLTNPSQMQPFVPARWGRDALALLGEDSIDEALKELHHLNPDIDRTQPVTITHIHHIWGPFADPDGSDSYFDVVIADFTHANKASEETEPADEPDLTQEEAEAVLPIAIDTANRAEAAEAERSDSEDSQEH